jgi:hypothetical protein
MEELFRRLFGITSGIQDQPVAQAFPLGQGQVEIAPISAGDMPIAQPVVPQTNQGFSASQFLPSMDAMRNRLPSMENLRGIIPTFAGLEGRINEAITPQLPAYMQGLLGTEVEAQLPAQARRAGLLNAAAALMQASGPQDRRISLGQALGAGLQGYQQGSQGAFDKTLEGLALRQKLSQQQELPGVVGEYNAALKAGYISPKTTLTEYIASKRPPGTTVNVSTGGDLMPGQKKADEKFADDYVAWKTGGGQDMVAQISQLKPVIENLESGKPLTGVGVAVQPDILLALTNPEALQSREQVEEVVQRNLRAVLGAQFTEKEGERLIARAFNPKLKPEQNAKRLRRLFLQMATAAEQKQSMVEYFDENGTLRGFKGKMPSISDFVSAMEGSASEPAKKPSSGNVSSSKFPSLSKDDIDLINRNLNR